VAFADRGTVHLPALIAATIVPLQTPLQSQIWCESGRSASVAGPAGSHRPFAPDGEEEFESALWCIRARLEQPHQVVSGCEIAEQARRVQLPVAMIAFQYSCATVR